MEFKDSFGRILKVNDHCIDHVRNTSGPGYNEFHVVIVKINEKGVYFTGYFSKTNASRVMPVKKTAQRLTIINR